jgi:drug/metabolite transporter (DMT)-like permease
LESVDRVVTNLRTHISLERADFAMMYIVIIWGLHFVVVKDALSDLDPLVFQSIRFTLALPIFWLPVIRRPEILHIERRDFVKLVGLFLIGPIAYQIFFILAIKRTTSTNTALLVATMPTWTALLSIILGKIHSRAILYFWITVTLVGVSLVVVGRNNANLSLSGDDVIGSGLAISGAIVFAIYSVLSKPLVDRYKFSVAVLSHAVSWFALTLLALPQLVHLSASDVPSDIWPNLLYSGILAGAGGYMIWNYALQTIGPARAALYHNFTPLIATVFAVVLLGEVLTPGIILGGLLTLLGVAMVRHTMRARVGSSVTTVIPRFAASGD